MTVRTKGDMCGLTVRDETVYGKISTTNASLYSGTMLTLSTPDEVQVEDIQQCGTMVRGGVFKTGASFAYTAVFNMVRGKGWEKWMERVLGALSGTQRDIPSYDTLVRVASDEELLWTGCKVDQFKINAPEIGGKLEFTVDAMCRWHTMTPFQDSDGSSLSMSPVAVPAGAPITFNRPWEWSADGTTFLPIKGKSFTLTVSRSLTPDPGISNDTDEDAFRLDAGEALTPQDISIQLDISITSVGPEWDAMRLAFTSGLTLRTEIDGKTVTLKGCYLDPRMPDRSQSTYDETISVNAADISVV